MQRALCTHVGQRREVAVSLLVQAYRAADALADKFAYYDLSARIIGLMLAVALSSAAEARSAISRCSKHSRGAGSGSGSGSRYPVRMGRKRFMPSVGRPASRRAPGQPTMQ